ncbi:N6-Adenosine-Methyltransferase Catalytic Subunit, partial [Manis pentadactyla]
MVIWVQLPGASDSEEAATHTGQGTRGQATAAVLALLGVDVPPASSLVRKYRVSVTSPAQDPAPQESMWCQQLADAQ